VEGSQLVTSQDRFIAVVRNHLRDGIPENVIRPIEDAPNDPIEYTLNLTDTLSQFIRAAEAVDAEIVSAPSDSLDRALETVINDIQPALVAVSADTECSGIKERLVNAGIDIAPRNDINALAEADLGISGSIAAIALTGSIVVDSRHANGRLVSLLPTNHLALVRVDRIVRTPGDLLRNISTWYPDGLPSNLVFITGPSRSADIELQITKGVHGPQRLLIACR
jgi:L-lactate dehydrogenase complex protein LldG